MLTVRGVSAGYSGQDVIHELDLEVNAGEVVAIIGSNGAGKSTLFRSICGMIQPSGGTITFEGVDITALNAYQVARTGFAYVPAERHLFPKMSVLDNLSLGSYPKRPTAARFDLVYELFPRLKERESQHAGTMSGGEQQMLAVGRALMSDPKLLMLDEPTTGLAPILAVEAYAALSVLRDEGLTILVAEQQVPLALKLANRGYVMENGRFQLEGTASELASNPEVRRAYLGVS